MKVAKLVYIDLVVRVVCDENATDEEINELAKAGVIEKVRKEGVYEAIVQVDNDLECPYDSLLDDEELFPKSKSVETKTIFNPNDEDFCLNCGNHLDYCEQSEQFYCSNCGETPNLPLSELGRIGSTGE